MEIPWDEMFQMAQRSNRFSYAPYSKFHVSAAVCFRDQIITLGVNVENASYGLTNCAERTAIFSGVAKGAREILAVVVFTPTEGRTPPCGACRQVINEFAQPEVPIRSYNRDGQFTEWTIAQLLPEAFGPKNL